MRKIIKERYEFCVVGGGFTGLCAALASARNGAKTALIHDRPVLGGNGSSEIRMHICGASANMKKPELSEGGIIHELMLSNKSINDSFNFSIWDAVLFAAAKQEKNLTLYLNTTMHDVKAENGVVKEIECYQLTTEKHIVILADFFADCTGNGTLCVFAGASYRVGSESRHEYGEEHAPETANNARMGNTLLFKAVDKGHPVKFEPPVPVMHFTEEQLRFRKHSPDIPEDILKNTTPEERRMLYGGYAQDYGYWWIELCGEQEDIVGEYEEIRDQLVRAIYGIWDHIKNEGDHGAENYDLVWVGMLPGTRESRRIECDHMLNEQDLMENRRFEDVVAYGGWHIDNHFGLLAFDRVPSELYEVPGSYDIPYRSYCVKGFQNLFVGGRCMGASKMAMSSIRVMGTCAIGGQAIGTAAAILCGGKKQDVRDVDVKHLQQQLLKDDCYLPNVKNEDPFDLAPKAKIRASSEADGYPAENVISGISRTVEGSSHQWRSVPLSEGEAWLSLTLPELAEVSIVQLTLDSDFYHEKKITLSSRRQQQQILGVPRELLCDFDVQLLKNGEIVDTRQVRGNRQRLIRTHFNKLSCDEVRVRILSTNGDECARIFEIRIYE